MHGPVANEVEHLMQRAQDARSEHLVQSRTAYGLRGASVDTRLALQLQLLAGIGLRAGQDVILNAAVDLAIEVLEADCGNVQRVYRGRGLELVSHRGFESLFLNYFAYVDDTTTACGFALRAGKLVCVKDITESPVFRNPGVLEQLLIAGVRAVSSMPLVGGRGEVVGMLSVHYRAPREHTAADRMRMQTLARAVGRIISP